VVEVGGVLLEGREVAALKVGGGGGMVVWRCVRGGRGGGLVD